MDSVSRAIGSLEASVVNLQQAVESQGRVFGEKLEEGANEFAALRSEVKTIKTELGEIVPAVKRFERARQRSEGKRSLLILMYGGIVAFATGLGYAANFIFDYLKHRGVGP